MAFYETLMNSQRRLGDLLLLCCLLSLVTSCASLPPNVPKEPTLAITDTSQTRLGEIYSTLENQNPEESGFFLLSGGLDAFTARLQLCQLADISIDAQYYMVHSDLTGAMFVDQLVKAADRGVKVRLLIDDMDLEGRDKVLATLASHPQITVKVFNPFDRRTLRMLQYVTGFGSVTRRMHNKSFTVDNQVTIVGGRNIGDEYFDADPSLQFGDLDLLSVGPIVQDVSRSFDDYWHSSKAYPINILHPDYVGDNSLVVGRERLDIFLNQTSANQYKQALANSDLAKTIRNRDGQIIWGDARILVDKPEKLESYERLEEFSLAPQLKPYLEQLQQELLIFSPYFVPGKNGVKYLSALCKKGVRVRIITNSLSSTDVALVHAGYAKYRRPLLRAGVELYEMNKVVHKDNGEAKEIFSGNSKVSLHAKSFVIDRKDVFIGSLNLDPRSITENTEIGIMILSKDVADSMVKIFEKMALMYTFRLGLETDDDGLEFIHWKDSKDHIWTFDPYTSFFQRFAVGVIGLLPIESQL